MTRLGLLMALVMVAALLSPTTASAGFDPDEPASVLDGQWVVVQDNAGPRAERQAEEHQVEGVVLEWTEIRDFVYEGRLVGGGYEDCFAPGTVMITEMIERSAHSSVFNAIALDATCTPQQVEIQLDNARLTYETPTGRMQIDDLAENVSPFTFGPDTILGDWAVQEGQEPTGTIIRITGFAPDYQGVVLEAEPDSCFSDGQVVWPDITWGVGLNSGSQLAGAQWGTLGEFSGIRQGACYTDADRGASWALHRLNTTQPWVMSAQSDPGTDLGGFLSLVQIAEGSPTPIEPEEPVEPPGPNPLDYPMLVGPWREIDAQGSQQNNVVDVRWTGDPHSPFLGTFTDPEDEDASQCPPQDAPRWRVTGPGGPSSAVGEVTLYTESVAGCELDAIVPATFDTTSGLRRLAVTYTDVAGTTIVETYYHLRRSFVHAGQRLSGLGVAFAALSLNRVIFGGEPLRGGGDGLTLYVATAANFPDGLAVAGLAGRTRGVTVLIDPDDPTTNAETLGYLSPLVDRIVAVGGEAVVPSDSLPSAGEPGALSGRLAGTNRFHTAQVIADAGWPEGAGTVFVATGANYPDALSGGAAASVEGAPVLLVDGGRMPEETSAALTRLRPDEIVVLGGTAVIPDSMISELGDFAPSVIRLAGAGRQQTAVAVAEARFPDGSESVLVTSGDRFGEALIAASAAWIFDAPLLLVGDGVIADEVIAEAVRLGITELNLLATDGTVASSVIETLAALVPESVPPAR